jgi:hypothetical protein
LDEGGFEGVRVKPSGGGNQVRESGPGTGSGNQANDPQVSAREFSEVHTDEAQEARAMQINEKRPETSKAGIRLA